MPRKSAMRQPTHLRIVGGEHRGRKIDFDGNPATRPMKDRVREAVFNLVGPAVKGKLIIDLFAGTGAMALEALSRGAAKAIAIERRFPTSQVILQNASLLAYQGKLDVITGDTFRWWNSSGRKLDRTGSWLVFCCPPFAMYLDRTGEMMDLLGNVLREAPEASLIVVECDTRFDTDRLSDIGGPAEWDVRKYPPAVVAMLEKRC